MDVLICSRTESVYLLVSSIDGFCFFVISQTKLVLLACLYLNLSKNSSLTAFFRKADAKVRLFFEPPKLFQVFLKISFQAVEVQTSSPIFSISTSSRFPLESGCKITALQHICQMFNTTFLHFYATFLLTR